MSSNNARAAFVPALLGAASLAAVLKLGQEQAQSAGQDIPNICSWPAAMIDVVYSSMLLSFIVERFANQ